MSELPESLKQPSTEATMHRIYCIKNSITKWGIDAWERLRDAYREYVVSGDVSSFSIKEIRRLAFLDALWYTCGFCELVEIDCDSCVLFSAGHCYAEVDAFGTTMSKIYKAWMDGDEELFHEERRKLVKFMAQQLPVKKNDCKWAYEKGDLGCTHPDVAVCGVRYCEAIVYISDPKILSKYGEPIERFDFSKCHRYEKEASEDGTDTE